MSKSDLHRMDSFCSSPSEQLLKAVRENNTNQIRTLIRQNPDLIDIVYPHPDNNPILYIAINNLAETTLSETVQVLIDLGANLFYKVEEDDFQEAIHFATRGQNPSILSTIIRNLTPQQINSTTSQNANALIILLKNNKTENFEKCLNILIKAGVDVNCPNKNNQTAIAIAAGKKNKAAVKILLDSCKNINIEVKYGKLTARELIEKHNLYDGNLDFDNNNLNNNMSYLKDNDQNGFINSRIEDFDDAHFGDTYLQVACERNLKDVVEYLLQNHADVYKKTEKNPKTPIEIASLRGFWEIFEMLIPHYDRIPNLLIPLLANSIHDTSETINYKKCLDILFKTNKFEVNVFENGTSALHFAAKYTNSRIVLEMLKRGASLANRNDFGFLPIRDISPKTLNKHFDNCIEITHNPAFDKENTIVTFDYNTLMPTRTTKSYNEESLINNDEFTIETDTVRELAGVKELKPLLKHPLITSFLYLKWHKIRNLFYINLLFYTIFVLSLLFYIFTSNGFSKGILTVTYFILLLRETSQILIAPGKYFLSFENWLELTLIAITGNLIFNDKNEELSKQFSAVAIFLSSLEFMLLIGQHPKLSTYIVIFRTVSCNFFKFLLWYSILILAFVCSFYKLFKTENIPNKNCTSESSDQDFFTEPDLTFIKIIIMLTGEFDASNLNLETVWNKLLFLIFVFLIPIILFNLLNGLAVSDTQIIKNDAEIVGYIECINHIVYVENMMMGSIIPSAVLCVLRRCSCCFDTKEYKQKTIMKRLAKKICLFPLTFPQYKMEMYLNMDGKVKRDYNNIRCKRLKEIYMDEKTVKRVKWMMREKNDREDEPEENYAEQIKKLQETIEQLIKMQKQC